MEKSTLKVQISSLVHDQIKSFASHTSMSQAAVTETILYSFFHQTPLAQTMMDLVILKKVEEGEFS